MFLRAIGGLMETRKGVSSCILGSRMIGNRELKIGEEQSPPRLLRVQAFGLTDVLQVPVIHDDLK